MGGKSPERLKNEVPGPGQYNPAEDLVRAATPGYK